jgi:hypothetical protein
MPVYTVHAPSSYGVDVRATPDRFVFIRDGFYFWAFVASVVWLAWHRLWLVLFGYVVLTVAAEVAMSWFGIGAGARMLMMLIVAALVGLEAGSLWRWTLRRRKWQQLDVVVADDEEAAERVPAEQADDADSDPAEPRDPKLWDPVPVTLPTYVSKPPARRTVRTIDLDATGVWTSGRTEADSALAREADAAEAADRVRRRVSRKGESDERAVGS